MINRRKLISLITGFAAANTSPILFSLAQEQDSNPTRKRNLPFFLGWYDDIINIDVSNQVYYSKGIDLLMPYVGKAKKGTIQAYLDAAKKVGIKVLLEIYRPLVESENISEVKNFIRTYKNHPSVYGWYLYDEPEVKQPSPLSPDLLTKVYQAIKVEDQSKPVALVFGDNSLDKITPYANAMDILMWDRYPCEEGVSEFEWVRDYRENLYGVFAIANIQRKLFFNVIQAYSSHDYNKRLPTKAEFRYMFYLSVITGADGLLFWMHPWSSPSWNESVLYPTIKEFRDYIPAIVRGEDLSNPVQVNRSDIEVKLFPIPNTKKFVMIAVNHNPTQINFTVKLSQRLAGKSAVSMNNKTITNLSTQASFNVILNPYEVHLYQIQ
jgi:hypothetical protein